MSSTNEKKPARSRLRLDQLAPEYDVVVIGGGLGGLTCANKLARLGHSVLLAEQHYILGGLAAYFKRKGGHVFDVSLHGFPYGMVKSCRKYWTREIADSIVQLKSVRFDNPQFQLDTTYSREDFTRILQEKFGIEPDTIERFFTTARSMNFYDGQAKTTRELFQEFFPDRTDVWRLLMEPITYANGSGLDDPAITYGIVFSNFMNKGVFTFRGGTDKLILKMWEELTRNGVDVCLQAPVEKIMLDHGRVTGVRIQGKTVRAKTVVSNANLKTTICDMIGRENLPADFAAETAAVRLSTTSSQVYLGIRKGEKIPFIGDLFFTSTHPEYDWDALTSNPITSRTYSVYYPDIRPARNMYAIAASINTRWELWAHLSDEEYAAAKQTMIDETLAHLSGYIPNIRDLVDHVEAATPRTFHFYTRHKNGASFGTKFEGLKVSENLPKVVPGAFHTGSTAIIMSGWLGSINYGVIVANKVDSYLATVSDD